MHKTIPLSQLRLAEFVRPHDVIGWPQGPGEPLALTEALVAQRAEMNAPALLFGLTQSDTLRPELAEHFRFRALNGAGTSRRVTALADIVPSHVSAIPALLREGHLHVDVALIQVKPLSDGIFTLGVIADFTQALIQQARVVIALVNPALPATAGDACVRSTDIDVLVESDVRIIDMPDPEPSWVEHEVARQVAALIPDRATVQLGVGTLPVAVAQALSGHQELGVHSGVVSDVLISLIERGVVTNAHKGLDAGRTVTGGLFGTQRLRDFAARTGLIDMRSVEYTHNLAVTSRISQFHTINSAIEIDLSGQVNAEVAGGRYLGAVGGQVDFVRAGVASPGGRSIIAFPSATPDGKHSRIVASLGTRPVTTARSEVDVIITEYGAAHLRGCPLQERARRLIEIAHPAHRESLSRALHESRSALS
ncbi:acetyl-CoA hydrolase/transferase family protein [Noviherbaspirillum sedimenti]|uniref:Acetyl-CoA hydrolase/transferase family protein n=1 Tax=Noviherbaspirillum sedimenti TaxID=2320865 RepID=A0A3A3G4A1_9BURK|nr:acetyl-CoA hydrolase/transferase C-terminal domain-containing protein [Noviherbaspirillum sedimenti]RJG03323.1 acetyl-CoA hydrolase/transferase family protein [Noviherbaspirillum sedimenti]